MALNRKPLGSVVRNPPDWFARHLAGAGTNNGPCAGNLAGVGIYNNASDGSVIRVYGINLLTGTQQVMFFKSWQGRQGTLVANNIIGVMIDPRQPQEWGQLYTQATAAGVGTAVGWVTIGANQGIDLSPGYPLGIIPPGWGFSVECTASNTSINCGFRYLSLYE